MAAGQHRSGQPRRLNRLSSTSQRQWGAVVPAAGARQRSSPGSGSASGNLSHLPRRRPQPLTFEIPEMVDCAWLSAELTARDGSGGAPSGRTASSGCTGSSGFTGSSGVPGGRVGGRVGVQPPGDRLDAQLAISPPGVDLRHDRRPVRVEGEPGLGQALGGLGRVRVGDPLRQVSVGDFAEVPSCGGVLFKAFPGLVLQLQPEKFLRNLALPGG